METIIKKIKESNEYKKMFECEQNNKNHFTDVGHHTMESIKYLNKELELDEETREKIEIVLLLHDIGKPVVKTTDDKGDHFYGHPQESRKIAENFTNDEIILNLIEHHDDDLISEEKIIKRFINKLGKDFPYPLLWIVKECDIMGQHPQLREEKLNKLTEYIIKFGKVLKEMKKIQLKDLAVNGQDLISIGIKGKEIGNLLNTMLKKVRIGTLKNEKESIMKEVKKYI